MFFDMEKIARDNRPTSSFSIEGDSHDTLIINNGFSYHDLEKIYLDKIKKLCIGPNNDQTDLSYLKELSKIEKVEIHTDLKIDISFLNSFQNLNEISGFPCRIKGILDNPAIEKLYFTYTPHFSLTDRCVSLKSIAVTGCSHPESFFNKFTNDNKVTYLCIQRGNITNLNCIINLQSLNILRLISISKLENFDGIEKLSRSLSFLEIDSIKNIKDYSNIGYLDSLKTLIISKSSSIEDLSFLKSLTKLESLRIIETRINDKDLKALEAIPKLALYHTGVD